MGHYDKTILKKHLNLGGLRECGPWSLKSIPILRPIRLKSHTLFGGTNPYSLYRGVTPWKIVSRFGIKRPF